MSKNEVKSMREVISDEKIQLKEDLFKSGYIWLENQHRIDRLPKKTWRIYDKLYDFTDFAKIHPGGIVSRIKLGELNFLLRVKKSNPYIYYIQLLINIHLKEYDITEDLNQ